MSSVKLCECGCGQPTQISLRNHTERGHVKGQPYRFRMGHYIKKIHIKNRRQWPSAEERFWKKVKKSDGCWLWTGAKTGSGYGTISVNGQQEGAHRFSWMLANNQPVPKGMMILHSCDTPLCVRPEHLSIGTLQENSRDMAVKGRASKGGLKSPKRGEQNPAAILNENQVRSIKSAHQKGVSIKQLAEQYGVTKTSIRSIVDGKTWKHVE